MNYLFSFNDATYPHLNSSFKIPKLCEVASLFFSCRVPFCSYIETQPWQSDFRVTKNRKLALAEENSYGRKLESKYDGKCLLNAARNKKDFTLQPVKYHLIKRSVIQ